MKSKNEKPLIGIRAPILLHQLLDEVKDDNGSKSTNAEGLNALWAHVQYKIEEPLGSTATLEDVEKKRSALLELISRSVESLEKLDALQKEMNERKMRGDVAKMIREVANN